MAGGSHDHLCSLDPQALSGQRGAGWRVVQFPIVLPKRLSPEAGDAQSTRKGHMQRAHRWGTRGPDLSNSSDLPSKCRFGRALGSPFLTSHLKG